MKAHRLCAGELFACVKVFQISVYWDAAVGEGLDPPDGKSDLDGRIFRSFWGFCTDFTPSRCEIRAGRVKTRPYKAER